MAETDDQRSVTYLPSGDGEYHIKFYRKENGHVPVREFLDSLSSVSAKLVVKVFHDIDDLSEKGPDLGMPETSHLDDNIYELRTQYGNDRTRVLFFFMKDKDIIMTHGFVKKTQKTPPKEIETAKRYYKDYIERGRNDGKRS